MKSIGKKGGFSRTVTSAWSAFLITIIISFGGSSLHAQPRYLTPPGPIVKPGDRGGLVKPWGDSHGARGLRNSQIESSQGLLEYFENKAQRNVNTISGSSVVLSVEIRKSLEAIGNFMDNWNAEIDRTSQLLEGIGFGRNITNSISGWRQMSSYKKLEYAYRYAVKFSTKDGGKKMITALISSIKIDYPGNGFIKKYADIYGSYNLREMHYILKTGIFPLSPIINTSEVHVDENTRLFIKELSDFIEDQKDSNLCLIVNQIREYFDEDFISESRTFSGSSLQFLTHLFGRLEAEEIRVAAMRKIVSYLAAKYPASYAEFERSTGRGIGAVNKNTPR